MNSNIDISISNCPILETNNNLTNINIGEKTNSKIIQLDYFRPNPSDTETGICGWFKDNIKNTIYFKGIFKNKDIGFKTKLDDEFYFCAETNDILEIKERTNNRYVELEFNYSVKGEVTYYDVVRNIKELLLHRFKWRFLYK